MWRTAEALPGPGADTDDALRHYAGQTMGPTSVRQHLPDGTDGMSVVDSELRVHGISGFRIAGSSALPSIVSGDTDATVYAIAERVATLAGR